MKDLPYIILDDTDLMLLQNKVNDLYIKGYRPLGGIVQRNDSLIQPMYKEPTVKI